MDDGLTPSQRQERLERFYLDHFLSAYGINPEDIARGDNPPDFIVKTAKLRIAVEITEFHSDEKGPTGHPRRLIEEEWTELQGLIREGRERHPDLKRLNCWIAFKELALPSRKESLSFVKQLLDFCLEKLPSITSSGTEFSSFGSRYELLGKYVRKIFIQSVDFYITWEWNHSGAFVGLCEKELEDCIRKKMQISRPGGVDENWLLIVSGHQISQTIGLVPVEVLTGYHSVDVAFQDGPYDKVFIFQYMHDRILVWDRENGWIEERPAKAIETIKR